MMIISILCARTMKKEKPDSKQVFQDAMSKVTPIPQKKHSEPSPKKNRLPLKQVYQPDDRLPVTESYELLTPHEPCSGDDYLSFQCNHLHAKTLRKLRQGKLTIEDELDLHGHTVAQAHEQLTNFLQYCQQQGKRCVRIIHGKGRLNTGKAILKSAVNCWLREHPVVLAFCSCRPPDGGTGALYLLLKKGVPGDK
jgi:DNA-nicking Smr family endonuclease